MEINNTVEALTYQRDMLKLHLVTLEEGKEVERETILKRISVLDNQIEQLNNGLDVNKFQDYQIW